MYLYLSNTHTQTLTQKHTHTDYLCVSDAITQTDEQTEEGFARRES